MKNLTKVLALLLVLVFAAPSFAQQKPKKAEEKKEANKEKKAEKK